MANSRIDTRIKKSYYEAEIQLMLTGFIFLVPVSTIYIDIPRDLPILSIGTKKKKKY